MTCAWYMDLGNKLAGLNAVFYRFRLDQLVSVVPAALIMEDACNEISFRSPQCAIIIGLLLFLAGTGRAMTDPTVKDNGDPQLPPATIFSIPAGTTSSEAHAANGGWGRMTRLANGQWLSVSTLYPSHATHILQLRVSADNARTWTAVSQVVEPGRKMDNGEVIQLPNGAILLSGRSVVDNQSFHLPVYRSDDNGAHWTLLSMIDSNDIVVRGNHPSQGLWEPHFFLLSEGRVAVTYANEKHSIGSPSYSQVCSERVSADNGGAWGAEIIMVSGPGGGSLRPGMPVVTRMKNGQYMEVSEVVGLDNAAVHYKVSPDGLNWPEGIGAPIPLQHAGPFVASLSDGRVIVTSCSNEISYSDDYGGAWRHDPSPPWEIGFKFSWPAIYQTGPEEVAFMNTYKGVNIRFREFHR